MKKFNKILIISLCLILCICTLMSCSDSLDYAPKKVSSLYDVGDSVELDESHFRIYQTAIPANKKDGYISDLSMEVYVYGFDGDFTYFDATVCVTWSYFIITDDNPNGIREEFSDTVKLNASGDGSYKYDLNLRNCRAISDIEVSYVWHGSATKI